MSELAPAQRQRLMDLLGNPPFPWQERLLARLLTQQPPSAMDLPTGLGKTSVIAIWLAARSLAASHLARRLVYVVDRRAVVDQATTEAVRLREQIAALALGDSLGLRGGGLPISTLRGQFADNHEWLEDPTVPAIIVGTVDMIGSRLLFEGYACSRKMRPYHAAMLSHDTLFVLDEAHLVPPFEELLRQVEGAADNGLAPKDKMTVLPQPRLIALSATGRGSTGETFTLDARDHDHPIVQKRIGATKRIALEQLGEKDKLAERLAERAWELSGLGERPVRILVFAQKRRDAQAAKDYLTSKLARDENTKKKLDVLTELFVGGRRVRERQAAEGTLRQMGFIAGSKPLAVPAFLFATSAAEVGVDLDADHLVCDVVHWERLVQRLGRVNRRGEGAAEVVFVAHDTDDRREVNGRVEALARRLAAASGAAEDGGLRWDGSPAALGKLRAVAPAQELAVASTPAPLYPALTRPLLDAWSMTSLREHTGRPEVQPWLRGWIDNDPQTTIAWRRLLPAPATPRKRVAQFFEAAPPHTTEKVEAPTTLVMPWLLARVKALPSADKELAAGEEPPVRAHEPVAYALNGAGEFQRAWTRKDLEAVGDDRSKKRLMHELMGATLIVDARLGGLNGDGLLDEKDKSGDVVTVDGPGGLEAWMAQPADGRPPVTFRVIERTADQDEAEVATSDVWFERYRLPLRLDADENVATWLVVEKWRHAAATEEDRAAGRPQSLAEHQAWAAEEARRIAIEVGLPTALCDAVEVAAALHDEGKRAERWQRAFSAKVDGRPYAKTRGPLKVAMLDGYRHEFGSLPHAEADERWKALGADERDLVLHLIVAHHGFGRPVIRTTGCDDAPPSALADRAREVALRFFRLQERWGPWGLAWLETLVRAADQVASRRNDARKEGSR